MAKGVGIVSPPTMPRFALFFLATCLGLSAAPAPLRVLVWDERQPEQKKGYAGAFLGDTLAKHLSAQPGLSVKSVGMDDPDQGLADATLAATDVVVFWCHQRPLQQNDARMEALVQQVMAGKTGFIALHSAHWAKPFVRLMQERAKADGVTIDWVVVRNRLHNMEARNQQRMTDALTELAKRVGFRSVSGLNERVIYRELFPSGLTLIDKGHLGQLATAHIVARQELRELVTGLALPEVGQLALA